MAAGLSSEHLTSIFTGSSFTINALAQLTVGTLNFCFSPTKMIGNCIFFFFYFSSFNCRCRTFLAVLFCHDQACDASLRIHLPSPTAHYYFYGIASFRDLYNSGIVFFMACWRTHFGRVLTQAFIPSLLWDEGHCLYLQNDFAPLSFIPAFLPSSTTMGMSQRI